jgi:hypothetical protein
MPNDELDAVGTDPIFRIVRRIIPWIALALVAWVLVGVWGSFQRAKEFAATTAASTVPTVTAPVAAPSETTTVTDLIAVTRVDVKLLSQPLATAEALASSKKGVTLEILARQGTWFRVKDRAGHIGWIPNDVKFIDVRSKK